MSVIFDFNSLFIYLFLGKLLTPPKGLPNKLAENDMEGPLEESSCA